MNRTALRFCPICSFQNVEVLHKQRFALPVGHPLENGYDVVVCEYCGFVYADTSVSQSTYDNFYSHYSKYEDNKTGTGGIENEWDRKRQAITVKLITKFLNNIYASIADIGCANGGLLNEFKKLGYESLLGIDPSPVCVENTRKRNIHAKIGSISQPLEQRGFNCVILSHTLEHIQDLSHAAVWIKDVLSDNGYLYLEVPDSSRYVDFIDAPFQDFNIEHINHFSMQCLHNYLNVNGFEPLHWGDKVIPASENKMYPAIYCFARKSQYIGEVKPDRFLKKKIISYINVSSVILEDIEQRISASLKGSNRLIVWGTGQLAMKLLVETSLAKAKIVAFVDSNQINQGKILCGTKIIAPENVIGLGDPILIASTLHQKNIIDQIKKMGIPNSLILL